MSTRKRTYSTYTKEVAAGAAAVSASKRARPAGMSATQRILARARGRIAAGYTRRSGFYGRFGGRGGELKFFDTALSFSIDATGEVPATGQLTLIPQGVTESTRVGRKCVIKSISMKVGMLLAPGAAATASGITRIYLMLDKQTNGAAAAVTDAFTGADLPTAHRNLANSGRFMILKTWVHRWNPAAGATTAFNTQSQFFDYYKKCNIPIEYSSTTGAIGEIKSNNIFIYAGSTAAIDDAVTVLGAARLRFADG